MTTPARLRGTPATTVIGEDFALLTTRIGSSIAVLEAMTGVADPVAV
ncbi:MAG: hypothetical protein HIU57_10200 [Acidobacteria bacterium]|nr:hypothetical protein [Acidobacteriota bacterium]